MPGASRVSLRTRGPRPLAEANYPEVVDGDRPGPPPPWFNGSLSEWHCHWALTKLGATFDFQSPLLGGRLEHGGMVINFLIAEPSPIGIRIQGSYRPSESGSPRPAVDEFQRVALENEGVPIIDIDEEDILREPLFYVREALRGVDHSRARLGPTGG